MIYMTPRVARVPCCVKRDVFHRAAARESQADGTRRRCCRCDGLADAGAVGLKLPALFASRAYAVGFAFGAAVASYRRGLWRWLQGAGWSKYGSVFKITPSGALTALTLIRSFCDVGVCPYGAEPAAGMIQAAIGAATVVGRFSESPHRRAVDRIPFLRAKRLRGQRRLARSSKSRRRARLRHCTPSITRRRARRLVGSSLVQAWFKPGSSHRWRSLRDDLWRRSQRSGSRFSGSPPAERWRRYIASAPCRIARTERRHNGTTYDGGRQWWPRQRGVRCSKSRQVAR